jgi:hypothetical protein
MRRVREILRLKYEAGASDRRQLENPSGSFRVPGCCETEEKLVGLTDL